MAKILNGNCWICERKKCNKFLFSFHVSVALVCVWGAIFFSVSLSLSRPEMFRMRNSQSTMGFRDIRYLDLFGVLGKTSWPWCAFIVCTIRIDGQMERHRIRKNEGMWRWCIVHCATVGSIRLTHTHTHLDMPFVLKPICCFSVMNLAGWWESESTWVFG